MPKLFLSLLIPTVLLGGDCRIKKLWLDAERAAVRFEIEGCPQKGSYVVRLDVARMEGPKGAHKFDRRESAVVIFGLLLPLIDYVWESLDWYNDPEARRRYWRRLKPQEQGERL